MNVPHPIEQAGWRAELPAGDVGTFEWDVEADRWLWSDEMYDIHGYAPGQVVPSFDLVVSHKSKEDRQYAERVMGHAGATDFRFHNLHWLIDAHGTPREVLSIGSAGVRTLTNGERRHVIRGYMLDLRDVPARRVSPAFAGTPTPSSGAALGVPDGEPRLTERELKVLDLIAVGCSNVEIAAELFLSVNTVKVYVRTAYRKIGVTRRVDAVLWAHRRR